jgi:hypothetical protein
VKVGTRLRSSHNASTSPRNNRKNEDKFESNDKTNKGRLAQEGTSPSGWQCSDNLAEPCDNGRNVRRSGPHWRLVVSVEAFEFESDVATACDHGQPYPGEPDCDD